MIRAWVLALPVAIILLVPSLRSLHATAMSIGETCAAEVGAGLLILIVILAVVLVGAVRVKEDPVGLLRG